MSDIETRADIDVLMRAFYDKVLHDPKIGFFFTEVAKLDLNHHLPIIGDFWETIILGTGNYARHGRNPLKVHLGLNTQAHIDPEHFNRWLEIFFQTLDELFEGRRATLTKQRAQGIAFRFMGAIAQNGDAP